MPIRLPFPPAPGHPATRPTRSGRTFLYAAAACALAAFPGHSLAQNAWPPGTKPPERITCSHPHYPDRALMLAASGDVILQFVVGLDGQPRGIQVVDATAPQLFARTALAAVKRLRYEPMLVRGQPVEAPMRIVVRFEYL